MTFWPMDQFIVRLISSFSDESVHLKMDQNLMDPSKFISFEPFDAFSSWLVTVSTWSGNWKNQDEFSKYLILGWIVNLVKSPMNQASALSFLHLWLAAPRKTEKSRLIVVRFSCIWLWFVITTIITQIEGGNASNHIPESLMVNGETVAWNLNLKKFGNLWKVPETHLNFIGNITEGARIRSNILQRSIYKPAALPEVVQLDWKVIWCICLLLLTYQVSTWWMIVYSGPLMIQRK
jgi:hypothetical protein